MNRTGNWGSTRLWLLAALLTIAAVTGGRAAAAEPSGTGPAADGDNVNLAERADIGLAALNLYSTFGCIGLAAEGWEAKLYDEKRVSRIMADVSRSSNLAVRLLKKAIQDEPGLTKTTPAQELIECYVLLDRQAQLLSEAAKSKDPRLTTAYHTVRDEAWKKITAALGIEE